MAHRRKVRVRSVKLLQELRLAEDLTIRDIADRLPIGKTYVGRIFAGDEIEIAEDLGELIAPILGVKPKVLFESIAPPAPVKLEPAPPRRRMSSTSTGRGRASTRAAV